MEQLGDNPSHAKRKGPYGHAMLPKLPFRVVFEVQDEKVIVYQVRHTSRKPSKKFGP
ncbi:MAG: type II toxin-antitoxin system RelE/ParE family toxin [Flavobacteriales bacterium]|nr:type II toxin-antitoxin system RelE/ParE family toxin [Flavobacteriales bacterium]